MSETVETKKVKFCEKDNDGLVVSFKFGDGETMSLDLNELSDEVKEQLMIHGMFQKGGDSYAGASGDYAYAREQLAKIFANLQDGKFNAGREAGPAKPKVGELAMALAEIKGLDVAAVATSLEAADDEKVKSLRAHPAIKAKIAEIRARKAAEALAKAKADGVSLDL